VVSVNARDEDPDPRSENVNLKAKRGCEGKACGTAAEERCELALPGATRTSGRQVISACRRSTGSPTISREGQSRVVSANARDVARHDTARSVRRRRAPLPTRLPQAFVLAKMPNDDARTAMSDEATTDDREPDDLNR
jgi:hypothetical protein